MEDRKKIFTNPCHESWDRMTGDERQRLCLPCKENVRNVSDQPLVKLTKEIASGNPCVRMNTDQIQFFQFFRSMSKVAGLSAAMTFFPFSDVHAQDLTPAEGYCLVSGKLKSNIISNRLVFVVIHGRTIETKSNKDGSFALLIPKGEKIQHTNIRKLNNKTLEKDVVKIRKVRLPKLSNFIGTPSF